MDFSRYGRFLRTPGVPRLFVSMLVGRLPGGMMTLAIMLRVTGEGGSYALAGAVTAAFSIAIGIGAPLLSWLVDRHGQTVVLAPTAVAVLAATISFAALSPHDSPALLVLAGALVGAVLPPITVASRALCQHGAAGGFAVAAAGTALALGSALAGRHVLCDDAAVERRLVAAGGRP